MGCLTAPSSQVPPSLSPPGSLSMVICHYCGKEIRLEGVGSARKKCEERDRLTHLERQHPDIAAKVTHLTSDI